MARDFVDHRRLRIVHVITSLRVGGLETLAVRLAAAQMGAGHRVAIMSLREGSLLRSATAAGVPVHVLGASRALRLEKTLALSARLLPDVIHAHNPTTLHYAVLAKLVSGARLVMTDHGQGSGIVRVPSRLEYLMTDAGVAVSESAARRNRLGRFREASVIPNGIAEPIASTPPADVRRLLGLPDHPVGICVASLTAVKAHEILLQALVELSRRRVRVTMLLAGDGPRRAELEDAANRAGLNRESVRFLGERYDIPDLVRAADFKVLCSRSEGIPLSILEAMRLSTPVVAPSVGGIPEIIRHEESGLLVPPDAPLALADAIERLCADSELRASLGRVGQAVVLREFGFDEMCHRYESLYRKVLMQPRRLWAPSNPATTVVIASIEALLGL
jgi:glycosyltransferase involved in cell wall biosynthesis